MSRRITFTTIVDGNSREKAIQPKGNDLVTRLLDAITAEQEFEDDHAGLTVFHVTATKEVYRAGETESSMVDHRLEVRITLEHLPQNIAEKEAARGDAAPGPKGSGQRLVELGIQILKRIDRLLFDSFMVELMKELGKGLANKLLTILSILIVLFIYYVLNR
jgi:hypothetical protein